MMSLKQQLTTQLKKVLEDLNIHVEPSIDYPADPKFGDYSTNVAMIAAKQLGKNPRQVAEDIVSNGKWDMENGKLIHRMEIAGPGFINFWVSQEAFCTTINSLPQKETAIPQLSAVGQRKKIIVEYSSPNIAKPFTIGHLRSTIIGDAIANLLEATGWEVFRDNHVGDWGTQFGKQIYALIHLGEGSLEKNLQNIEHAERPVEELVKLYVQFHDEAEKHPEIEDEARTWFKKLENGDAEARKLWELCISWSWREFEAIYEKLGVKFTENTGRGYGESFFEQKMQAVVDELHEKNLLKHGENGAQLVFFSDDPSTSFGNAQDKSSGQDKYPPLMILKKDGSTLYATRDLATDKFRREKYGEAITIINEVGAEQTLYFRQLFELEHMLGWFKPNQRVHVKHGLFRFKEGKMSTRKGNVIWLEDVLEEAEKRAAALEKGTDETKEPDEPDVSRIVGIGAIKWNDLKRSPEQDIVFDWDDILNMQGNSGPYMQYVYVRTQSVLRKAEISNFQFPISNFQLNPEERDLLRLLAQFPEKVEEAASRFAPNVLATYLFDLAQAFNGFYQKHQILKAEADAQQLRIALTAAVGTVIAQGLKLLGIKIPEHM